MQEKSLENIDAFDDDELIKLINGGQYVYFQVLINRYMPIIISLASSYKASGLDIDDFIQEGIVAIFSAVKVFDATKASFKTFATLCIKRAMASALLRVVGSSKHIPNDLILPIDEIEIADKNSPENILIEKESYTNLENDIKNRLSSFEYQVLCEFLSDKTYTQIAQTLSVSTKSVDNALKRIRLKIKQ